MTPQQKATELVKKYKDYSLHYNSLEKCIENAKRLALIAVEEIKKANPIIQITYWNEVKAEIEKL